MRMRSASVERRVLAGRAARHEKVDARVDLPAPEAPDRRFVELAALRERRDQRRADSGKWRSHVLSAGLTARATIRLTRLPHRVRPCIVNQPRFPCNPFRRGQRAPRERRAIARRVRQRNRFGRAVEPHRVRARDETGARRRRRRSAADIPQPPSRASSSSAVPDGASFFAAVMRSRAGTPPKSSWRANSARRVRDDRFEQHDAGRKIRRGRRSPIPVSAIACRSAASPLVQPVVPSTMADAAPRERRHVVQHRIRRLKNRSRRRRPATRRHRRRVRLPADRRSRRPRSHIPARGSRPAVPSFRGRPAECASRFRLSSSRRAFLVLRFHRDFVLLRAFVIRHRRSKKLLVQPRHRRAAHRCRAART